MSNKYDETVIDLWAKIVRNWQAINQAQMSLSMAKNKQQVTFQRLLNRIEGHLPERMVVVLGEVPFIIDLDIEEFRIVDITVATMTIVKENDET